MKFIEKKCPNCGGDLEFKANDTEVTCKYCQRSFIIEKENNSDLLNEDAYNLIASTALGVFSASRIIFAFVGIIIFIIAIVITIVIANTRTRSTSPSRSNTNTSTNNNPITPKDDKEEETLESLGYVTKYNDIGEKLIKEQKESGKNQLDNHINFYVKSFMPKIVNGWTYVGSYFLTSKDNNKTKDNILYDVYSIVYRINKNNVKYYGVVQTHSYKYVDNNVVSLGNSIVEAPRNTLKDGDFAFGFISNKELLNTIVSKKITDYNIEYIGNVSKLDD